jgi:hypothetical protein
MAPDTASGPGGDPSLREQHAARGSEAAQSDGPGSAVPWSGAGERRQAPRGRRRTDRQGGAG